MFSNNFLSILTGIHVAAVSCEPRDEQSNSCENEKLFFKDFITLDKKDDYETDGEAAYDTFVTTLLDLRGDELLRSNGSNAITDCLSDLSSFKDLGFDQANPDEYIAKLQEVLTNLGENIESNSDDSSVSDKISSFLTHNYDLLKDIFYETDNILNLEGPDALFADRFINYFLRRFDFYVSQEQKRVNAKIYAPTKQADLLTLPNGFNTKYYAQSFDIFKRIVTSSLYQTTLKEFITILRAQLLTALTNETKLTVFNTRVVYYVVLTTFLNNADDKSDISKNSVDTFVNDLAPAYFGVLPIPYTDGKASSLAKNVLRGITPIIDNAAIDENNLSMYLE